MPRVSAEHRRADAVRAALAEFGARGYERASTAAIARTIGVSQPYLFRLFETKHALFLAAVENLLEIIEHSLREAAEGLTGEAAIAAMEIRYRELLADGNLVALQLQMLAAAPHDDACRRLAAEGMARLWWMVADAAAAAPAEIERLISRGMLLSALSALGVPSRPCAPRHPARN